MLMQPSGGVPKNSCLFNLEKIEECFGKMLSKSLLNTCNATHLAKSEDSSLQLY